MISVVIPSAGTLDEDGRARLEHALAAVAYGADEILVITTDDKMTLEGADAITAHEVEAIHVDGPFNFSAAANKGFEVASCDDVLLLNDDVRLAEVTPPRWLDILAKVQGDILGIKLLDSSQYLIEHGGVGFQAPGNMPSHRERGNSFASSTLLNMSVLAVTAACMLVRRSVWEALGGFDERLPINYGDVDFCLRAREQGFEVTQVNSLQLVHDESSTRGIVYPTEQDYRLIEQRHREFLRGYGVHISAEEAIRRLPKIYGLDEPVAQ